MILRPRYGFHVKTFDGNRVNFLTQHHTIFNLSGRLEFEPEKGQDPKDYDVVMDSDEDQDDDEDDIDLLPQFDGASDHIPSQ